MSVKLYHELDSVYETIFLLYSGYDMDRYKKLVTEQLNLVKDKGEEAYQKIFAIQEKYLLAFNKYRITSERDGFYFKDTSMDYFISFVTPIIAEENFIGDISGMDNDRIWQIILKYGEEIFEQDMSELKNMQHTEFIQSGKLTMFVDKFDLTENEKWKLLLILQNPKEYYTYFCKLIQTNAVAFDKAVKAVKTTYDKYMEQFKLTYPSEKEVEEFINKNNISKCDIQKAYPSMASAGGLIILDNSCYIGLLIEKMMSDIGITYMGNEYLLSCLKALSDQSKMNILTSLKARPKYSAELANQLGLTSATISHHMNVLLTMHLVYVEKENGKYYFHINREALGEMMEQLKKLLL